MEAIILKIKQLLDKKKMAIPELAEKIGLAKQSCYDFLSGKTEIKIKNLEKISTVLEVSMLYWFEETNSHVNEQQAIYGNINKNDNNRVDHSIIANGNNINQSVNEVKCHKELDEARKKIIELQDIIIKMHANK